MTKNEKPELNSEKNKKLGNHIIVWDREAVEKLGNAECKILAKAFEEFARCGLTASDRGKLKALDEILPNAEIRISKEGDIATIEQSDGKQFSVRPKGFVR